MTEKERLIDGREGQTDLANARRFVRQHGQDVRYVSQTRKWLVWDGRRWKPVKIESAEQLAKETADAIWRELQSATGVDAQSLATHAKRSASAAGINAMLTLARSEPSVVVDDHQLDRHPWRLNCRNGTLNLKTGELSPHSRGDLITKWVAADYDPDAKAPCWEAFLERILPDRDVRQFLQRATGYALSGSVTEQCLFLLIGSGANGKTTYIEAIRSLLGKDYARTANFETLLMRRYEGGPREDITRLRGARFVSAIESDEGCRLSESVIKQLTGGDMIAARALFQSTIEFIPEFKLFLATNHKPEIRGTDIAIWRRIYLIPFGVRIPREERDSELSAKLRREHSGILAWAVRGCSRWQRNGLRLPEAVQSATARYREEMDPVAQFLRDCCDRGNAYRVSKREVFSEYRSWCDDRGLPCETENALGRRLTEKGFEEVRTSKDRFWRGLRVRVHADGDRS